MKTVLCMVLSGAATLAMGVASAVWVDQIVAPFAQAHNLHIVAWISAAILIGGSFWFWHFSFKHLSRWIDP